MYFYYFTILLFFIPSLFESSFPKLEGKIPYKKFLIGGVITVCIFQMGLRWETGTDWIPYLEHFDSQNTNSPFINTDYSFETGYNFLVWLSKCLVPEYSFFLLLHAVIFFLLLKKGYEYFSPYSLVTLLLFYVSFLGIWGSNRQLIAAGLGVLSLTYLYEKKWWAYALCIFLAFSFHSTSLLIVIFVFLNRKFTNYSIIITLFVCIVIGFSALPYKIFSLFGGVNELTASKATAYLKQAKENDVAISIIGLIKRVGIFILFFIYKNKISREAPKFNFIFNGYTFSLCFYFLFAQTLPVMISRGSLYFNMLEPILVSHVFYLSKDRRISFWISIVILVYCFLSVNQAIATYPELFDPYKGVFINTDYQRNMF